MAIENAELHGLTQEQFDSLEAAIDRAGIARVLHAMAQICGGKSEHVAVNWQDHSLAKVWAKRATFFDDKASTILFSDG